MDEQKDRKAQQDPSQKKKLGLRGMGGRMKKEDKKGIDTFIIIGDQKYKVENMAKGGRAGYKMGSKCKIAKKGKGRAYGKNS
jgi:histidyl-tRNA synthetase